MRRLLVAMMMLLGPVASTQAQVSVGISLPGVNIGINVPTYPELVLVPDYPVYYAPRADWNYFFYDGMYWVYQRDNWYASAWYNGPWYQVGPEMVPLFILRIPVRYYRHPPAYFRGWQGDAPPHWGEHWGRDWEGHRGGWDRWERGSAPAPAPLPVYQRQYSGDRYPRATEQQHAIRSEQYRYQPKEAVTRQHYDAPPPQPQQAKPQQQEKHQEAKPAQQQQQQQQQAKPQPQQAKPQQQEKHQEAKPAQQQQQQAKPAQQQQQQAKPQPQQAKPQQQEKHQEASPSQQQGKDRENKN
jgi:hypothetical protein